MAILERPADGIQCHYQQGGSFAIPGGTVEEISPLQDYRDMVEHLSSTADCAETVERGLACASVSLIVVMICGMITEESDRNISMLEILGYRDRGVRSFVLSSGHLLVPVGFVIGVPLGYLTAYSMKGIGAVFRNAHEPAGEGGNDSCGICVRACGIYSGAGPVRKENTPRGYGGELKECGRVGEYEGGACGCAVCYVPPCGKPDAP